MCTRQTLRSNASPSNNNLYLHANVPLMQSSAGLGGSFFSLELVKSLKTKSKAVPRVHRVCFAPGSWASSRTKNLRSSDLTLKGEQRRCLEGGRPLAEPRMSAGRPARLSAHALSAILTPPPEGRGKRGPRWPLSATGVSLSSVRNGQWTRPNGAGTWALTCGSG